MHIDHFPEVKPNLYIHVPKTGGMSIKKSHDFINVPFRFSIHHPLYADLVKMGVTGILKSLFVFTTVRHPYDRAISGYYFGPGRRPRKDIGLNEFILTKLEKLLTEDAAPVFTPQHELICDDKGELFPDYLIRYETLADDWEEVCGLLGVRHKPLPHNNPSSRRPAKVSMSQEAKDMIYTLYQKDFDILDYER